MLLFIINGWITLSTYSELWCFMESNSASFIDQYHGLMTSRAHVWVLAVMTWLDAWQPLLTNLCVFVRVLVSLCVCVCVCIHSDKRPYWNARETTVIRCEVFVWTVPYHVLQGRMDRKCINMHIHTTNTLHPHKPLKFWCLFNKWVMAVTNSIKHTAQ